MFIAVYVDDLILGSPSKDNLQNVKAMLSKEFKLVDKGELSYFLGWEIEGDGETGPITIGQQQYIKSLLERHGMVNCRKVSTQLDPGCKISPDNKTAERVDKTKYQSLIGELMYIPVSTRPDIAHSVSKLAQFSTDSSIEHENGVKHILRYLSKTTDFKLHYKPDVTPIYGYADADWGGESRDRKSYSGYVFLLSGAAVSWESKKQSIVALSTTEAEYVALSSGAKEAIYLKHLLEEIGYHSKDDAVIIKGDNLSSQYLTKYQIYHARTKHIDMRYHHLRDSVKCNLIKFEYVPTTDMVADLLTKNLSKEKHFEF